jgi:hypothetical protein
MLIGVNDIAGVFENPAGDFGDNTLVVGTIKESYKIAGSVGIHGQGKESTDIARQAQG